jgi:hypothetical protein
MKKNLIYVLAGGVAAYLVYQYVQNQNKKKGNQSKDAKFLNATGRTSKTDPCGCYGTKGTQSRGTAQQTLSDGSTLCENSYGYAYVCDKSGTQVIALQ